MAPGGPHLQQRQHQSTIVPPFVGYICRLYVLNTANTEQKQGVMRLLVMTVLGVDVEITSDHDLAFVESQKLEVGCEFSELASLLALSQVSME